MNNPSEHALYLTRRLLEHCGIDPEGLEEENKVLLSIDYQITIFIIIENRLIHILGLLGSVVKSEGMYLDLLRENFKSCTQSGYNYSIEPEHSELLMSRTMQGDDMEAADLIRIFEDFVKYAEVWSDSLRARHDIVPERAGPDQPEKPGLKVTKAEPSSMDILLSRV